MDTSGRCENMSKVITEEEIRKWVQDNTNIQDGELECAEGIKYDFRLGNKFLKAYFGRVMDYQFDLKSAEDIRKAVVEPGEVVFVLSQGQLGEDVRGLKNEVSQIANDLLKEATKREQENKALSDKFAPLEMQLREINNKTIENDLKLGRMQEDLGKIEKNTSEIYANMIKSRAEDGIKGKISTAILTFVITALAGVVVAFLQG